MLVHDTTNAQNSIISRTYVLAQLRDKDEFWEHLIEFNTFIDIPWCLIGDSYPMKKRGTNPPHQ